MHPSIYLTKNANLDPKLGESPLEIQGGVVKNNHAYGEAGKLTDCTITDEYGNGSFHPSPHNELVPTCLRFPIESRGDSFQLVLIIHEEGSCCFPVCCGPLGKLKRGMSLLHLHVTVHLQVFRVLKPRSVEGARFRFDYGIEFVDLLHGIF